MAPEHLALAGRFGVELEMEGLTLGRLRQVVADYLGPEARDVKGGVLDRHGRLWEVKPDLFSIVEVATPPLSGLEDVRILQGLAARLMQAGATVSTETGVHVHVDARELSEGQIVRLLGLVAHHEADLISALKMHPEREFYCGDVRRSALAPMLTDIPKGRTALMRAYRGPNPVKCLGLNVEHLAPSNFGTLELRYFNGTLNPSVIGAHVGLALAFVRFAQQKGPMPSAASVAGGGDLPTLLHALDLRPNDPPSIFLYRNMLGLGLPPPIEKAAAHPRPKMLEMAPFVKMGVDEATATEILAALPRSARIALVDAAKSYLAAIQHTTLHGREMLALSRMSPTAIRALIGAHAPALQGLKAAEQRAEALAWLSENASDYAAMQEAFGELTFPYMIAAPRASTLRLLARLRTHEIPLQCDTIPLEAFQKLAYMQEHLADLHLDTWKRQTRDAVDPYQRNIALQHIVNTFAGVPEEHIRRVLHMLHEADLPFDMQITTRAFRALAALPDAQAYLDVWLEHAPTWCRTPWDKQRFLEDVTQKPLDLLRAQVHMIDGLPRANNGYSPLRDMMQVVDPIPLDRLPGVSEALRHVAPHLKHLDHLKGLPRPFGRIDPAKLRAFVQTPLDLSQVSEADELYVIQAWAQGKNYPGG